MRRLGGRLMVGNTLMAWLIFVYLIIAVVFLVEGNYPKAWYWVAAAQITGSVLLMK